MAAIIDYSPLLSNVANGRSQITGTAQRLGAASIKRIRLYSRRSGHLLREVFSAADGTFEFAGIAEITEGYVVMELDDESNTPWLDPACADRVTPELMP